MSFTLFWPLFLPSYSLPSVNGHSTLLTIATEFAAKARGAAMSLVAFCFMGGGGIGTALGGRLIKAVGFEQFFSYYGLALLILVFLAGGLIKPAACQQGQAKAA